MRIKRTAIALLLLFSLPAQAELLDRIACVVDDEVILYSEVEERALLLRARFPNALRSELLREATNELVADKLLENQLVTLGIEIRPSELQMAIDDVVRQNGLPSEEALKLAIERQGMSWEDYRERLRKQLAQMKLINLRVRSQVKVDEEEVRRRYAEIVAAEKGEEELRASHLLVHASQGASPQEVERARQVALSLLERARAGEDFETLASVELPSGPQRTAGDLGWFRRGEMVRELEEAAFSLAPGEVSEPIRTRFGWHILRVDERREVPPPTLEATAAKIREVLYQEELQRQTQRFVESLKKDAVIEYPMAELAPPTARTGGSSG